MDSHWQNPQLPRSVYIEQPLRGVIVFAGKDRVDFLQRQTTNDASQVNKERVLTTVLTSPVGRILDVLQLTEDEDKGEAQISAISLPGRASSASAYFKSRIFFMDQVTVRDVSQEFACFELAGADIENVFQQLGFPFLPQGNQLAEADFQGIKLKAFQQILRLGLGYQVIAPQEHREQLRKFLKSLAIQPLTSEEYEVLRVEAGIPVVDHELTEEYSPLEVNLENAVSVNKGCYTGQEVIARQMNYDKVTRKLVGLSLEMDAAAGSQLQGEGKPVGKVTSFVRSPRFGPIALAVVKRPYYRDGVELTVKSGDLESISIVRSLPFRG